MTALLVAPPLAEARAAAADLDSVWCRHGAAKQRHRYVPALDSRGLISVTISDVLHRVRPLSCERSHSLDQGPKLLR